MKKLFILFCGLFLISGCDKDEIHYDTVTYTTYYPIEYATDYMFGDYSDIKSVYPSGADTSNYELTSKQKEIYSDADLFIYAGATKEVNWAVDFLNQNPKLTIIDATKDVSKEVISTYGVPALWLDPSNYLMVARYIKSTLVDYEDNVYNQEKIEEKYKELKVLISEIDVDLTMMGKKKSKDSILVTNDVFLFLSKYNINVISIDPNNENLTKSYSDAKKLIDSGDIKYVYYMTNDKLSDDVNKFIDDNNLEKLEISSLDTLSDEERKNGEDYLSVMSSNITKFKTELFR